MTTSTTNLGLTVYNNTTDQSGSFITWTRNVSGSANSNMTKIDAYAGGVSASLTNLSSNMSGSITTLSGSITNISGSITSILADIATLNLRLYKIAEFSGAGQADFNNISGSWTHLLLMGVTSGSLYITGAISGHVVTDFNGDATSSNYSTLAWTKNSVFENLYSNSGMGGLVIGSTPHWGATPNYGIPFMALIPNYSTNGGLYKNALGISSGRIGGTFNGESGVQGGFWRSTAPITRVRVFCVGSIGDSFRRNFYAGTKITLYGLG